MRKFFGAQATRLRHSCHCAVRPGSHFNLCSNASQRPSISKPCKGVVHVVDGIAARVVAVVSGRLTSPRGCILLSRRTRLLSPRTILSRLISSRLISPRTISSRLILPRASSPSLIPSRSVALVPCVSAVSGAAAVRSRGCRGCGSVPQELLRRKAAESARPLASNAASRIHSLHTSQEEQVREAFGGACQQTDMLIVQFEPSITAPHVCHVVAASHALQAVHLIATDVRDVPCD